MFSRATKKRLLNLRGQFRDMLESMNVAMRAGSTEIRALESSRDDLKMLYSEQSDIVREVDYILAAYENGGIPLRRLFRDFANRSGLEDVESFASIYEVIEGKSSRSSEILRQTQQVISDKMEIEAEIETMITSTKSEQTMMLIMPILIVGCMSLMGEGFMDVLYTTTAGRLVSTLVLVIFAAAFFLSEKLTSIKV